MVEEHGLSTVVFSLSNMLEHFLYHIVKPVSPQNNMLSAISEKKWITYKPETLPSL